MNNNKILKIVIGILLIALISTVYATYHLWTTKQIGMNAKISTTLNLGIYNDTECTIPLTEYDWGNFGAREKNKVFYFKNLGNDVGYLTYNLTSIGWTLNSTPPKPWYYYYYTDQHFNFSICGGDTAPNISIYMNPEGSGETTYIELQPGQVGHLWMRCWTEEYLSCSSAWTVYFHFWDNLP